MSDDGRRDVLIDSDAFHCFRALGLLTIASARPGFHVLLTEFVARHELVSLQREIAALESARCASVHALAGRNPDVKRLRNDGVDRGEAEIIAFALTRPNKARPVLISNDRRARIRAEAEGVRAGDLLDFVVGLMDRGLLSHEEAEAALTPWDDRKQQQCRPSDWKGFMQSVAERRQQGCLWNES